MKVTVFCGKGRGGGSFLKAPLVEGKLLSIGGQTCSSRDWVLQ